MAWRVPLASSSELLGYLDGIFLGLKCLPLMMTPLGTLLNDYCPRADQGKFNI